MSPGVSFLELAREKANADGRSISIRIERQIRNKCDPGPILSGNIG